MVGIIFFNYFHKDSVLHGMDGRLKLFCMILFSVAVNLTSGIVDYLLLTLALLFAIFASKLPLLALLKEVRYFAILILVVIGVDALVIPGTPLPWLPLPGITIEGLTVGLLFAWRIILVIILCTVMIGTTSPLTLKNVIEWYLRPVPFISETRVATMISLTFVLIPVIFDTVSEMSDAQKARYVEGRRNPLKRILFTAFPLLLQTFRRADEIILAMEARCYSEDRTKAIFKAPSASAWLILGFSILVFTAVLFL